MSQSLQKRAGSYATNGKTAQDSHKVIIKITFHDLMMKKQPKEVGR